MGKKDDSTPTRTIVDALTRAIVEHRLHPGTKLAEQKLADHFGVSRTLVRQALFQLVQKRLIRMEPARGAFVATPSAEEARQVFATRRMLELEMTRSMVRERTPERVAALKEHAAQERAAIKRGDVAGRTELLGDFHVHMAKLLGNQVLAQILNELISRCALITLMYQTTNAAEHSAEEHTEILKAIAAKDEETAVRLMDEHLRHVEENLSLDRKLPSSDIAMALRTPTKDAEDIKVESGYAKQMLADPDMQVEVPGLGDRGPRMLSRQALAGVIEPRVEEIFSLVQQVIRDSGYEEVLSSGIVLTGGSSVMPGMVELGEDIFLKPVRRGIPHYGGALSDMVAQPRAATVMGLLEEARLVRMRGFKAPQKGSPVKSAVDRLKDWFVGNF